MACPDASAIAYNATVWPLSRGRNKEAFSYLFLCLSLTCLGTRILDQGLVDLFCNCFNDGKGNTSSGQS